MQCYMHPHRPEIENQNTSDNEDDFYYEKPFLQRLLFNDITALLVGSLLGYLLFLAVSDYFARLYTPD
jgi:hypothetical protein